MLKDFTFVLRCSQHTIKVQDFDKILLQMDLMLTGDKKDFQVLNEPPANIMNTCFVFAAGFRPLVSFMLLGYMCLKIRHGRRDDKYANI